MNHEKNIFASTEAEIKILETWIVDARFFRESFDYRPSEEKLVAKFWQKLPKDISVGKKAQGIGGANRNWRLLILNISGVVECKFTYGKISGFYEFGSFRIEKSGTLLYLFGHYEFEASLSINKIQASLQVTDTSIDDWNDLFARTSEENFLE